MRISCHETKGHSLSRFSPYVFLYHLCIFLKQGLLLIDIAVAVLLSKCQTNSCEKASLESKIIQSLDLCSLRIFIPVLSPFDCSFCCLQCFVQFFLSWGFMV